MKRIRAVVDAPFTVVFQKDDLLPPESGEAIVSIKASAVCGSDLHIFCGRHPSVELPTTVGHEFSGDIVAVGPNSNGFQVGDRVTLEPAITCGECNACRRGQYGYCKNISFSYRNGDGAMANYIRVKTKSLFALPPGLSYEAAALIEPLSVSIHAVRRSGVALDDTVAIIGAGAIGILVAAVARACGARIVAITDISDTRLEMASRFGATHPINIAGKDALEELATIFPNGADRSFECVGQAATFRQAMFCLKRGGVMTQVGIFEEPMITIDASRFVTHEITVIGAQGYCWDFQAALELAHRIPLESLITHTFPLHQLQTALQTASDRSANSVKVLIRQS